MKKSNRKIKIIFLSFLLIFVFGMLGVGAAWGPLSDYTDLNKNSEEMGKAGGFDTGIGSGEGVGQIAELVIEGFLSVLGVIFIILMIVAGYNWMSAAGDEQKVQKAKDTILRAIIGLIILVSAYAITYFVFKHMPAGGNVPPVIDY
ncbi:hypothetical protein DRH27_00740 [Candidatus Falkowbacteria bacterium]|nr:MAG: hypothetical protein DRH27_00740 [Candidatus Falkowbacteria bacterium]